MEADIGQRFRCAAFPAVRLEPLAVPVREIKEVLVREPFGPIALSFGALVGAKELPEDVILQEVRALDFSPTAFVEGITLRAIVDFMREYGALDIDERYDWNLFSRPSLRIGRANYEAAVRTEATLTDDCAALLQLAQCLANHWIRHKDNQPALGAWEYWPFDPPITNEEHAWDGFTYYLNLGLREVAPQVRYQRLTDKNLSDGVPDDLDELQAGEWHGGGTHDLFDALCVQLYRIIVEDNAVLTCANEGCRKRFTIQRGTATAGQYHTRGVKYCSRSCAYTQHSRERRRRQKAHKP